MQDSGDLQKLQSMVGSTYEAVAFVMALMTYTLM